MVRNREPFAFARYGDGELPILQGRLIDYPEFKYDPDKATDRFFRERLLDSLQYRHPSYYVGISCPDCIGEENFEWVRRTSGQDEQHLTWSTVFVNSNYASYLKTVLPLYQTYDVILVCKNTATLDRLPFSVIKDFRIGNNAWKNDYDLVKEIGHYIRKARVRQSLFLFCAGPFAGILVHQLHRLSQENTYLDIGSTLDPYLFGPAGLTRGYLRGNADLQDTCRWIEKGSPQPVEEPSFLMSEGGRQPK
jgi:hypothetical protein